MKIKSVSGVTCYVKDLKRTAKFYEGLGFEIRKRDDEHVTAYSNWFWIDFIQADAEARQAYKKYAALPARGGAVLLYLSVEDVDGFRAELQEKGMKSLGAARDWPSGNREFTLEDPDGYHLVFFKRK